jgi:hypothetical protein
MGICGMVNVFVGNFRNLPAGLNPNSAQFFTPSYTYLTPFDERNAPPEALSNTPCVAPSSERRCLGNIAQSCQNVSGGMFFRSVQDCTATPSGGNFVQMCQKSTGQCCIPPNGSNCR